MRKPHLLKARGLPYEHTVINTFSLETNRYQRDVWFFLFFPCVRALNWEWNVNPNNYVCLDSFSFAKPFIKEKLYYFPTIKIITLILLIYKTKSKHIPTMKKCTPKTINTISKWSVYILYYYICCILLYKICKKINYLEPHEIWVLPQKTKLSLFKNPKNYFGTRTRFRPMCYFTHHTAIFMTFLRIGSYKLTSFLFNRSFILKSVSGSLLWKMRGRL